MNSIVVARYKEDILWVKKLNESFDVLIYNKYYPEKLSLPNKGREAHTYLHHIIQNYNTLDPFGFTVFTQANPFDHSPYFIENVNNLTNVDGFKWLTQKNLAEENKILECDIFARPHDNLDMRKIWEFIFEVTPCPTKFLFGPGAIFVCSNRVITQRPILFYKKCMNSFEIIQHSNSQYKPDAAAYSLERLWSYIFDVSII